MQTVLVQTVVKRRTEEHKLLDVGAPSDRMQSVCAHCCFMHIVIKFCIAQFSSWSICTTHTCSLGGFFVCFFFNRINWNKIVHVVEIGFRQLDGFWPDVVGKFRRFYNCTSHDCSGLQSIFSTFVALQSLSCAAVARPSAHYQHLLLFSFPLSDHLHALFFWSSTNFHIWPLHSDAKHQSSVTFAVQWFTL